MNTILLALYVKLQQLTNSEDAQDMVEYALVVSLISLAVIASVTAVGTAISTRFVNISTTFS